WAYALRLAGWPDEWPVWTGSCPCQPYSSAGARKGDDDPRALWWAWRWLIAQCRPPVIFGEQVASKAGREWLARVRADLEAMGYVVGAADLPAAGVGAPHIRQRLWWVAYSPGKGRLKGHPIEIEKRASAESGGSGTASRLAYAVGRRREESCAEREPLDITDEDGAFCRPWEDYVWVPCADGTARRIKPGLQPLVDGIPGRVAL